MPVYSFVIAMGDDYFSAVCLNRVYSKVLFRKKEGDHLIRLFGPRTSFASQSIFIYGHSSNGKTFLLSELLQELQVPYAWINCHETYAPRLLFSSLTQKLLCFKTLKFKPTQEKLCDNLCDFINFLKSNASQFRETVFLVFDNAEVLRNKDPGVLCALLRLQEIINANVSCIFISEIVWEKFRTDLGMCPPITVHFSDYSKDELLEILCLDCPADCSKDFFATYINVVLSVFFIITRNLQELRHLALINFSKYYEPVKLGTISRNDVHKLWRNIEPTLKDALQTVYLREVSGWNFLQKENMKEFEACQGEKLQMITESTSFHMTTELPFYSKFLLLACYLASYNPPSTDHKFFVKNKGKKKKKITKKNQVNIHLLGPKPFVLDRMLAIFYAIVEDGVLPSALILSQISSLVSLRLIMCITPDDQLSSPKYKCTAELALVRNIGRTVNFDIMGYLHDFN